MFEKYCHDADKHKHVDKAFYRLHFSNILINKTKLNNVLLLQTLMAFIFLQRKKINAKKRFSSFAKATEAKEKKGWGSAVAAGYGGTSWSREKEPFLKRFFSLPQVHHPLYQ